MREPKTVDDAAAPPMMPAPPLARLILWVVLVIVSTLYLWWVIAGWTGTVRVQGDALVYRAGSLAWLGGDSVYTDRLQLELQAGGMFFTYGPLALIAFVPIALLPLNLAFAALALLSWLALYAALVVWCRATGQSKQDVFLVALVFTVAASLTRPVLDHLMIGQVNAFLLLMASLDLLLPKTRWPRGILLGVAIAIKLTPAALLLLPLLRRDWRTILVAGATASAGVAASWLIVPREATYFWFTAFRDPGRIGNLRSPANQSIRGVIERWIDGPLGGLLWLVCALVTVVFVAWAVGTVLLPRGDTTGAAAIVFVLPALLSPVAWTHHWVWSFPLIVWLFMMARNGSRAAALLAGTGMLVLIFFPIKAFDPVALIPNTAAWSALGAGFAGGFVYWAVLAIAMSPWLGRVRSATVAGQEVGTRSSAT